MTFVISLKTAFFFIHSFLLECVYITARSILFWNAAVSSFSWVVSFSHLKFRESIVKQLCSWKYALADAVWIVKINLLCMYCYSPIFNLLIQDYFHGTRFSINFICRIELKFRRKLCGYVIQLSRFSVFFFIIEVLFKAFGNALPCTYFAWNRRSWNHLRFSTVKLYHI